MANLKYYVTANTAEGYVNLLDTNIKGIKHVVLLKHPSSLLKSKILRSLIDYFPNDNPEILLSALGKKYLDGFIIRDKSLAFLDESIAEGNGVVTMDLEEIYPTKPQDQTTINNLTQDAYDSFATGLKIHDDLEKVYIDQMDFERADQFADEFISNLLNNVSKRDHSPHTYHRLFGTNTSDGVVNVVPHLTSDISNVYHIKGRAGTGKSVFMKKIAKECLNHGIDIELYHCSFDPNSIDMVLVRDLDFCIFDSTDPHEFFPKREGEYIVDLYDELVAPGTDEKFEIQINELNNHYKSYMKKGISYLKRAGELREQVELKYTETDIRNASAYVLKNYNR